MCCLSEIQPLSKLLRGILLSLMKDVFAIRLPDIIQCLFYIQDAHFTSCVNVSGRIVSWQLTRKDLLIKNLKRMKKTLERDGQLVEAGK